MLTFSRGVHPETNKALTAGRKIEKMPPPKDVYIPLTQHSGAECTPIVSEGDYVKMGQAVAMCERDGVYIHSSVSGTVKGVEQLPTLIIPKSAHIHIENDFEDNIELLPPLSEDASREEILNRFKEAGIVGMGGAAFPTHKKLNPREKIDTFILNGAECEPYITCDHRLMAEKAEEIARGARIFAKVLGAEKIIIAIEDNKPDAIEAFKGFSDIELKVLRARYPMGAEKQLIYACTGRKVPLGGLPKDVGCVVDNVHTVYSAYLAVTQGIPCVERVVTVSGGAVENPGNFIIRVGTTYSHISEHCGLKEQPVKVLGGGPMMGTAAFDLHVAVAKATSSVLFLTEKEINTRKASPCINCGRCARVCPMYLMPMYIDACTIAGDYKGAKKYGAKNCIECGCCAYVCPAKRPLVQSIRLAKRIVRERNI